MKKTKILIIGMSPNYGGIEGYIFELIRNANQTIFQFDLISSYSKLAYEDELIKIGCKIHKISSRKKNFIKSIKEFKNILKNNYDYIHFNLTTLAGFEKILLASHTNSKIIIHSHNAGLKKIASFKVDFLDKIGYILLKHIDYYAFACSENAGKFMFRNKEFTILNNGIKAEKYRFNPKERDTIRSQLSIKDDYTVLGLVAAFLPVKNHTFLIDIYEEILKNNNKTILLLIGDGPKMEEIKNKIKNKNYKNKIIFLGMITDTYKYYSAMDLYVAPSLYEGFPLTLLETQANGLKCYVSDSINSKTNVLNQITYISLKKDAKEWANIIMAGKNDRIDNAVDNFPDEYRIEHCYNKIYNFYKKNK